ncbi:MAG TPA: YezD family protein [Luteimonas sp.]|nr:YezD family protein [Luteimonas sp.]
MSSRLPDIHANPQPAATDPGGGHPISDAERAVLDAVRDLAYGQVEVIVHSSRIVQITRSQKLRLNGDAA